MDEVEESFCPSAGDVLSNWRVHIPEKLDNIASDVGKERQT